MATHEGPLRIGSEIYPVAVLDDGTRVLTRTGMLTVLGRPYKGQYKNQPPAFISAPNLQPFITEDLRTRLSPISFKSKSGGNAQGFRSDSLVDVCYVYIDAEKAGKLLPAQKAIVQKCEIIIKALAKTGIDALIDEVTGYQEIRDRKALQAILDKYLLKEYAAWAKLFPDQFYQEMFRLQNWKWVGMSVNRPQCVGQFTNDLIYDRLTPGILKKLREINPKRETGHRKAKHHQFFTPDIGNPALSQHIHAVLALMRISPSWPSFYSKIQKAFPKKGDQLSFDLEES